MPSEFSITIRNLPNLHIAALHGVLDIESADELDEALVDAAGSTVIIDLSGLTLLDSRGVAALAEARNRVAASGKGELLLSRPGGIVSSVVQLTELDEWVTEWSPEWE